jgi:hypothetical protein
MTGQGISFCKKDIMSMCTADGCEEQGRCRFFKKASHENKCVYFIFNSYCSSLNAQTVAAKKNGISGELFEIGSGMTRDV